MFFIKDDNTICLTRGDIANIVVTANLQDGNPYTFKEGDIVRIRVFEKKDYSKIHLQKDVVVEEEAISVTINLDRTDTKIGEIGNKPIDYVYEIEVNPDTKPQTIIGHDDAGAKIFRLYPEGSDS